LTVNKEHTAFGEVKPSQNALRIAGDAFQRRARQTPEITAE